MNPNSLANLTPGGRVYDYSGRDLLLAAIAESLKTEMQTDDEYRHFLCKVDDFEITDEVRAEVLRRRAMTIYNTIFKGIEQALIAREVVSINGFARFWVEDYSDLTPIWVRAASNVMMPVLPSDVTSYDERTAVIQPGSWEGGPVSDFVRPRYIAAGVTTYYDGQTGNFLPWNADGLIVDGESVGVLNRLVVSSVGEDGINREYFAGGLSVQIVVNRRLVSNGPGADQDLVYSPAADQVGPIAAARAAAGVTPERLAAELGMPTLPMGIWEYSAVSARTLATIEPLRVAREDFRGVVASEAVKAFPRRVKVTRPAGTTYDGGRVPWAEFRARFGYMENYLRGLGAWPERVRGLGPQIRCEFRPEFCQAVNL